MNAARERTALSGGVLYAGASLLERVLFLLLLPLITREVSVAAFAQFALLRIGIGILQWLADAGTGLATVRYVAESSDASGRARIVGTFLWARLATGAAVTALAWPLLHWLGPGFLGHAELRALLPISLAALFLTTALAALTSAFRAEERHHLAARGWVIRGVAAAAGYVVFVLFQHRGVVGLMQGLALGEAAGFVAIVAYARRALRAAPSFEIHRQLRRYGTPAALSLMSPVFGSMDRYVVQRLTSTDLAGFYHLANGPAFAIDLLKHAAIGAIEPYFFGVPPKDAPKAIELLVRRYSFSMLALALLLSLFAPEIVALLAPKQYALAIVAVPPLTFAALCQAIFRVVGLGSGFAKQTRAWAIAGTAELVVALLLLFALTPLAGVFGAGLARFAGAFLGMLLLYGLTLRVFPTRLPVFRIATASVLGLGVSLALATPLLGPIRGLALRGTTFALSVSVLALVLLPRWRTSATAGVR